jgi:hypothetical protein
MADTGSVRRTLELGHGSHLALVLLMNGELELWQYSERIVLLPEEIAPFLAAVRELSEHADG